MPFNAIHSVNGHLYQPNGPQDTNCPQYILGFVFTVLDNQLTCVRFLKVNPIFLIPSGMILVTTAILMFLVHKGFIFEEGSPVLFIIFMVVAMENLFLVASFILSDKRPSKPPAINQRILIPLASKSVLVDYQDIKVAQVINGVVVIDSGEKGKISTQFNSLSKLEEMLPPEEFFRANRKTIIAKRSIDELKNLENRKSLLVLRQTISPAEVSVSRYKRKELVSWLSRS